MGFGPDMASGVYIDNDGGCSAATTTRFADSDQTASRRPTRNR